MLGQVGTEQDVVHVVAQQPMVDVGRHAGVVHCKFAQGRLHPVETGRLPDKVDDKVGAAANGRPLVSLQFDAHLVAEIVRHLQKRP